MQARRQYTGRMRLKQQVKKKANLQKTQMAVKHPVLYRGEIVEEGIWQAQKQVRMGQCHITIAYVKPILVVAKNKSPVLQENGMHGQ